jgi:hypothetical protein
MLVAPAAYFRRPGAELFETHVSYEDLALAARREGDRRSAFFAQALEGAVETYRRGWVAVPDEVVSDVWHACWEVACQTAPDLNFERPGPKPGRSTWFYFHGATGFGARARAVVIYKAERGRADLQFKGVPAAVLQRLLAGVLETGMGVVPTGKSSSVRVAVPPVYFGGSAETQRPALATGLAACERLRRFFVEQQHIWEQLPTREG